MSKNKDIENILDECLERILINGETAEQCLRSYPEYADELEPLLETAMAATVVSSIEPRPEFRNRARYQLQATFRDMEQKKSRSFFNWNWQPRWVTATVTIALVLLLSGGGTVAAAAGSMPDDVLYPVKLATEQARLTFTFSELGKAEVYAELANRRVDEIVYLAEKNETDKIEPTAERLNTHLTAMASLSLPIETNETTESEGLVTMSAPAEDSMVTAGSAGTSEESGDTGAEGTVTQDFGAAGGGASGAGAASGDTATAGKGQAIQKVPGQTANMSPERITAVKVPELSEAAATEKTPVVSAEPWAVSSANVTVDRRTELTINVTNQANVNSSRLRAVLEEVPELSKPVIEKAINGMESNYQKVIDSLEKNIK